MKKTSYIPNITDEVTLGLTTSNWLEVGQEFVCCYLDALLIKPGLTFLKKISRLAVYVNWPKKLVLNASQIRFNKSGDICIKSPYDGSKISMSLEELWDLIVHLAPNIVLMPSFSAPMLNPFLANKPNNMKLFWANSDVPMVLAEFVDGVYGAESELFSQVKTEKYLICSEHVLENLNLTQFDYVESNEPLYKALRGLLYVASGMLDIKDNLCAKAFSPIESLCQCPTCSMPFSKAYLHHLYTHTPLLCQRLLMQHNIFALTKM